MDNDQGGDSLAQKLEKTLENSGFLGEVIRHSPEIQGQDWNNVLKNNYSLE